MSYILFAVICSNHRISVNATNWIMLYRSIAHNCRWWNKCWMNNYHYLRHWGWTKWLTFCITTPLDAHFNFAGVCAKALVNKCIAQFAIWWVLGYLFTKKTVSYGYQDPLYKPKTVWRPSQFYNGNPYANKTVSYWCIEALNLFSSSYNILPMYFTYFFNPRVNSHPI